MIFTMPWHDPAGRPAWCAFNSSGMDNNRLSSHTGLPNSTSACNPFCVENLLKRGALHSFPVPPKIRDDAHQRFSRTPREPLSR